MSEIDDLKLLVDANQNYNVEAHIILHTAIDNERDMRIEGDAASMSAIRVVSDNLQLTESRLSQETLDRSAGDVVSDDHYTALSNRFLIEWGEIRTDLIDLQIDTTTKYSNLSNRISMLDLAMQVMKVELITTIDNKVNQVSVRVDTLQKDVDKYVTLLQDITTDSTQITMDNGEINAGAWTILSQAREWDLDIIRLVKKHQSATDDFVNESLEDIQNNLPNVDAIINDALTALGNSPIINELETLLGDAIVTIDGVSATVMEHRQLQQQEMIDMSQHIADSVKAETDARVLAISTETQERIDKIQRESIIRIEQVRLLNDGLTVEMEERIDGDNKAYELIENLKVSNGEDLANVYQLIAVNTDKISANATAITQLDSRLVTAQDEASKALVNSATALDQANTAVTATKAIAEQVNVLSASIDEVNTTLGTKVDTVVFNSLKAEVERVDGVTKVNSESITSLSGTVSTMGGVVTGHSTAIEALTVKQTQTDDKLLLVSERTTALESSVGGLTTGLNANVVAVNNLKTVVDKQGNDIKTVSENVTSVTARIDNLKSGGTNLLKQSNNSFAWNPAAPQYPHGQYWLSGPWVQGETYTLTWCVTAKNLNGSSLAAYAGGAIQSVHVLGQTKDREVFTVQFVKDGNDLANAVMNFYLLSFTSDPNTIATIHWAVLTRGAAIGVTYWEPGSGDLVDADNASAEALANLRAQVEVIDGKTTATANDLVILKSTVDTNHAQITNNFYTKAAADIATANQITEFKSALNVGGANLISGTRTFDTTGNLKPNYVGFGNRYDDPNDLLFGTHTIYLALPSWCGFYFSGFKGDVLEADCVLSFWASSQSEAPVNVYNFTSGLGYIGTVEGNTWKQYSYLLPKGTKTRQDLKGIIEFNVTAGNVLAYGAVQLQIGNKATEWSNSVDDFDLPIKANATAVNSLTTQVTDIDGKVASMASQVLTLESFKTNIQNGEIPGNSIREVNLTDPAYDQYLFYPVIMSNIPTTSRTHLRLMATLDGAAKPNWSTHNAGFSVNVDWEVTGAGWGSIDPEQVINNAVWAFTFNDVPPVSGVTQVWETSQPLVWVRGGGRYFYSVPESRSITICPPNGTVSSTGGSPYGPMAYDPYGKPVSLNQSNQAQSVKLQQTNEVIDGVKAVSTVSVNNNGFMSGYGLISQLVNGVVVSAFGIDADYFYVGKSMSNAKKPFMVLTTPQVIGGVTYPAGVWMDVALIANATIGTAHIQDASITNAKIVDLHADKITAGIINADRIGAKSITTEKLIIGDTTNLWANQYFDLKGARPESYNGRVNWNGGINEIPSRMGVQMYGRDHIAPYYTRIPIKNGESIMIEYIVGMNGGPGAALGVGLWVYDGDGSQGTNPYQFGPATWIEALGGGWHKYRRTFQVWDNGSGKPAAYGCLYFQIEQSDQEANPTYWTVGNVIIRKPLGGELIVNGAITADKLYSNTVSGMFANFGTMTTYKNPSNPNGARMVMQGSLLRVYDDNNVMRVRLGLW